MDKNKKPQLKQEIIALVSALSAFAISVTALTFFVLNFKSIKIRANSQKVFFSYLLLAVATLFSIIESIKSIIKLAKAKKISKTNNIENEIETADITSETKDNKVENTGKDENTGRDENNSKKIIKKNK